MMHIVSVRFSNAKAVRSLCGLWNPPNMASAETLGKRRLPKELCPACRRLHEGGKS